MIFFLYVSFIIIFYTYIAVSQNTNLVNVECGVECESSKFNTNRRIYKDILLHNRNNWGKVFKNGPSKICGRQSLKNFTWSILEYFVPTDLGKVDRGLEQVDTILQPDKFYSLSQDTAVIHKHCHLLISVMLRLILRENKESRGNLLLFFVFVFCFVFSAKQNIKFISSWIFRNYE